MKIYLHIGTEKTGTTSIQSFMAENRDELLDKKILYPKSLGFPNNINLAIAFQNEEKKDDLRIRSKILTPKDIKSFQEKIYNELKEEINITSPEVLVISSEHLSSRFNKAEEIKRLYGFLSSFAEEIEVIVYLRRQDSFYESLYSTAIKSGNIFEFSLPVDGKERHDFQYHTMLTMWEKFFKLENIIVRLFDKKDLHNSDVVEDFLNTLKIEVEYQKDNSENKNLSLGRNKLFFLKMFNQFVPEIVNNKVNRLRGNIVDILEGVDIEDSPIKLPYADRIEFLSRFEQGNRMIAKRYFSKEGELFSEISDSKDTNDELMISVENAIEIASKIWQKKHQEYKNLMNETLYLKCELLLEKKLIGEASKKISSYIRKYPHNPRRYYLSAKLSYIQNDLDNALSMSKKSLELNPSNHDFRKLYHLLYEIYTKEKKQINKQVAIVHVHIFKNAGSTFDWILQKNFEKNFLDHRKPKEMLQGGCEYLKNIYMENPGLVAVSSHHIPFNPNEMANENMKVLPVYLIREPIDRTLSVYKFEKKQKDIQNEGTKMAKVLDFPEYVRWSLTERKGRTLRNMNTMYVSGIRRVPEDVELEYAHKNLRETPLVGVVDRFDESMVVFEEALKVHFPKIDLAYVAQNVNQKEKRKLSEKQNEIRSLLGTELFDKTKMINRNDLELYQFTNRLLDERISKIKDFSQKLEIFRERCQKLISKNNKID